MNAPQIFVRASGKDVKLTWTKVDEAIGYEIYRGLVPNPTNLRDTITRKQVMYFDVAGSGVRHYRMRAIGVDGEKSPYSNDVRVVVT